MARNRSFDFDEADDFAIASSNMHAVDAELNESGSDTVASTNDALNEDLGRQSGRHSGQRAAQRSQTATQTRRAKETTTDSATSMHEKRGNQPR